MPELSEKLFQFIWQHRLLKPLPLITVSGQEVTVLHPGELNANAGPDFFNGRIRLNGLTLAGNIELHLRTSDWLRHGHSADRSYDNIVLHVVVEHDVQLPQNSEHQVEVLELKELLPETTLKFYGEMMAGKNLLACANQLAKVNDFKFISWLERMAIERLEEKVKRIQQFFESFKGDYQQTFYTLLLRNFGFNVNGLPFELIARHLPLQLILKHADNLLQVEALLLGMAGMLEEQFQDKYMMHLQNEFVFLKNKYQLSPLKKELFKFSRTRPANFPDTRLAQFAALVHASPNLFANPYNYTDPQFLKQSLRVQLPTYWKTHSRSFVTGSGEQHMLGEASAENLVINSFAPFFFFYAQKTHKPYFKELAIKLLNGSVFEKNLKTRLFGAKKNILKTAADSQALIHLVDHYCLKKNCLACGIAGALLKSC